MSIQVRQGKFDVLVVAAPGVQRWPGLGLRALSTLCAEMDLSVGLFGGEGLRVMGVLPLAGSGGVALVQDSQGRVHRIEGRSVVRVVEPVGLPDPFRGWTSPALIPLDTAIRLRKRGQTLWSPAVAILGTGNRALLLGTQLLESGVPEVFCIQSPELGFSGWEVHRRRFEMLGGKIIAGIPQELIKKASMLWEFRVRDEHGVRVLDVAWVVSAGPFSRSEGIREYPPESLLFELEQSSTFVPAEDVEGWALEEYRGRLLGVKIVKALHGDWGDRRDKKERLEEQLRRAKSRLRRALKRREEPFRWEFSGKWTASGTLKRVQAFPGVPQVDHVNRSVVSIECVEEVECSLCQSACPENAITISRENGQFLREADCTACGKCLEACPAAVPVLIQAFPERPRAQIKLLHRGRHQFRHNELAQLLNRQGEVLGSGKILSVSEISGTGGGVGSVHESLVEVDVPSHLAWEARAIRKIGQALSHEEEWVMRSEQGAVNKVEVQLQNERRLLSAGQPLALALFETGLARGEDRLLCSDGSCGLCDVRVDGVKRMACRTQVHRGMSVQIDSSRMSTTEGDADLVCPCSGVRAGEIQARIREGKLGSPDAIRQSCRVGDGRCRGRLCQESFRRILEAEGIPMDQWIDWRFPWSEWTI